KLLLCSLLLLPLSLPAQKGKNKGKNPDNEFYLLYDRNWQRCEADSAYYMAYVQKKDDTTYQWNNYRYTGPLISVETYRDEAGNIPNGYFAFFDARGIIDSAGSTLGGRKHGSWYYYNDTLGVDKEDKYENGRLTERIFAADRKRDTTHYPDDREAHFTASGDEKDWRKYIEKSLKFPDRATNLGKGGSVYVSFVIAPDGKVKDIRIVRSAEFSLDKEAVRVIASSPDWIPASQHGRNVNAYRRQPFTFAPPQ
ncbi:MAG: energy transducer TonB, partial [Chitinophagaceae bacterium]